VKFYAQVYDDKNFDQALNYLMKANYDSSILVLDKIISNDPSNLLANSFKSYIYCEMDKYDTALSIIDKTISFYSENILPLSFKSKSFKLLWIDSIYENDIKNLLTKIYSITPITDLDFVGKGYSYYLDDNYKLAIKHYNNAIKLNPSNPFTYYLNGISYRNIYNYKSAKENFTKAIEIFPSSVLAYYNRAITYDYEDKYSEAMDDLQKAIEINPQFADAYNRLGDIYKELDDNNNAIKYYTKAIELNPKPYYYLNRSMVFYEDDNTPAALEDLAKILEIDPDYKIAYYFRASIYSDIEDYQNALNDYNAALQSTSDSYLYNRRGLIYMNLNEFDSAIVDFTKAIELSPDFESAYFNRGYSYRMLKNLIWLLMI